MKRLNIALLAGGNSSEREIALNSAREVAAGLDHSKYDVKLVDIHYRDWTFRDDNGAEYQVDLNDFSVSIGGDKTIFDYALIIIHGTPGEDGMVQGYLEMMQIPFSSCSMTSSVITFDKISTKRALAGKGISMAREVLVERGEVVDYEAIVSDLGLPLFVKPNASGSSFGVSKVKSVEEIDEAVQLAFSESDAVLIEEAIEGREMGCGVMITSSGVEYILPITELKPKREFFDYEAKYTSGLTDEVTPAEVSEEVKIRLNELTRKAYKGCRCRGLVRIDFIVTELGEPFLIEINSIPGMSEHSIVPQQLRAAGLSVAKVYDIIIQDTCNAKNR
ncbi:MAG: D-alanine--D-alanine ligase [Rikenellaceae bacterium]